MGWYLKELYLRVPAFKPFDYPINCKQKFHFCIWKGRDETILEIVRTDEKIPSNYQIYSKENDYDHVF